MLNQACDACRQRKVKCDQLSPACSRCRFASLMCTYAVPTRKRGPKPRTRSCAVKGLIQVAEKKNTPEIVETNGDRVHHVTSDGSPQNYIPAYNSCREQQVLSAFPNTAQPLVCHQHLLSCLATKKVAPEESVKNCIDLYMAFVFPLLPIVCESTLRSQLSLDLPPFESNNSPGIMPEMVHAARTYSMTTALCALIAHIRPCESREDTIPIAFLTCSDAMLRPYTSYDIFSPTSTSLLIRIFQASCYSMMGYSHHADHVIEEAVRIAKQMRLHEEESYAHLAPLEAKLRRNAFWYLFSADRAYALSRGRTEALGDCLKSHILNVALPHSQGPCLLQHIEPTIHCAFEELLIQGFRKDHQIWKLGFRVLFDLNLFLTANFRIGSGLNLDPVQKKSLTATYLDFISVLDDVPNHIMSPTSVIDLDEDHEAYQQHAFWIQKINVMLTYHYLKLVILNRFAEVKVHYLLGLNDDPIAITLKKVEITHELVASITGFPFEALQANGEPCVEKLRYICATLLKVMHGDGPPQVVERAKTHFTALLDYLSMLNSRVSDLLVNT